MFENTKIKHSLAIGFGSVILLMAFLTIFGINRVQNIDKTLTAINEVNSVKQRYAINFRGSVHDRAISLRDVTLEPSKDGVKKSVDEIITLDNFYQESAIKLDQIFSNASLVTSEEKNILDEIKEIEASTLPIIEKVIRLSDMGESKEANRVLMTEAKPLFIKWLKTINQFIDYQEALNKTASVEAKSVASGFSVLMQIVLAIAILISVVMAYLISSVILKKLGADPSDLAKYAKKLAKVTFQHKRRILQM